MGPPPNKWAKYNDLNPNSSAKATSSKKPARPASRNYVPKFDSAAFHVLTSLRAYEIDNPTVTHGIGQSELVRIMKFRASHLQSSSLSQKTSAALKTLLQNSCVYQSNGRIFLDTDGRTLAEKLLKSSGMGNSLFGTSKQPQLTIADTNRDLNLADTGSPGFSGFSGSSGSSGSNDAAPKQVDYTCETWNPGDYTIRVLLDNREVASMQDRQGLANDMRNLGLNLEIEALSVGDCLWVAEHNTSKRWAVLDWIVERKTLSDLRSSIIDGRYHEQKGRLRKSGLLNVVYLIEFAQSVHNNMMYKENKRKFLTVVSHTLIADSFRLKFTKSQSETVSYLALLTECLRKRYTRSLRVVVPNIQNFESSIEQAREHCSSLTDTDFAIEYSSFQTSMSKSKMYTVGETFRLMLRVIKGISFEKASAIQTLFPTPRHLWEAYARLGTEEERRALISESTKDLSRAEKINSTLSALIYDVYKC